MKKIMALTAAAALMAAFLIATAPRGIHAAEPIRIVATMFPAYDWVQNVLGDNPARADVTFLTDNGVDMHSYQPSVDDILLIASCDLFLYTGGESDQWVDEVLQESANPDRIVINLLDTLGEAAKEETVVEGMQEEASEPEEESYDEHVWLSLRNASVYVRAISQALMAIDPEHADLYSANAQAYAEKLDALDAQYEAVTANAAGKTLLFGDRFPFRYLTDDYGLSYYAAFPGCSAETEASFETIAFLVDKVNELGLSSILTIEGSDHRIAEAIVQNTQSQDQQILTLDSMQAETAEDIQNGATYLSIMERNLAVLKDALQ